MPQEMYQAALAASKAAVVMYNTYAIISFVLFGFSLFVVIVLAKFTWKVWGTARLTEDKEFLLLLGTVASAVLAVVMLVVALDYTRKATYAQQSPAGWVMKKWCDSVF